MAGRFYPAEPEELREQVAQLLGIGALESPAGVLGRGACALVVPHAGYLYSGSIAGRTFAQVEVPPTAVVIGPNHTGRGAKKSLWGGGAWRIPGATLPINEGLAQSLVGQAGLVREREAHWHEHSIEVELPFLQARRPGVALVPICLGRLTLAECQELGLALAEQIQAEGGSQKVLLVASTDMSHYIPAAASAHLDRLAIERILALDPEGLFDVVVREEISMCGFIPTTVVLVAARALGASAATLVGYGNSGEHSGDFHRVVGYAGLVVPDPACPQG